MGQDGDPRRGRCGRRARHGPVHLDGGHRAHRLVPPCPASPFDFSAAQIQATDVGFGTAPLTSITSGGGTATRPVLRAGFATAQLTALCISKTESVPGIGDVVFKLSVPADRTVTANAASFDLTSLRGAGTTGIHLRGSAQIGQAAADLTTLPGSKPFEANPLDAPTTNQGYGWTGIDANAGDLRNVSGTLWQAQISGDIRLPDMSIKVGGSAC